MTDKQRLKKFKETPQQRGFLMEKMHVDEEARTVELAFSSEEPYLRWFGYEVLGHEPGEVDLSRMQNAAPLLVNHQFDDQVGVVESVRLDDDKRCRAIVRFSRSARGEEIFQDVIDGIRVQVSVGYIVEEMKLIEEKEGEPDVYRVTRWQPYECSLVSVAADPTVGVGRSAEAREPEPKPKTETPKTETQNIEVKAMSDKTQKPDAAQVDPQQVVEQERARVMELQKAGETYNAQDLAKKLIAEGGDIHDFNQQLLERGGFKPTKAEDPEIGLSEKETKQFSIVRLLNAVANPSDAAAQRAAAFELEASAEAANKLKTEARGAIIPFDVLKRDLTRDYNVGTATAGGNLVSTDLMAGSFIEMLEKRIALSRCGATVLNGLNGNIAIPRQTGGASHFWLAENGAPTESSATFDQVALTPKTVGAYSDISRRLLKQSSIAVEMFVQAELAKRLALALDAAGINGTGASNEPTGILNASGVGSVAIGANGGAPTWDHIVDLETEVAAADADVDAMCYLTNAKVRGKLKKTAIEAGDATRIWQAGDHPLNGYEAVVSNQVPRDLTKGTGTNLSAVIFGNFADLLIGMWGGLDITVDPYSVNTKGAVRITAFQDTDIAIRHPESFAVTKDVDTN